MKQVIFEGAAFDEFVEWAELDKKVHQRIVALIKDTRRQPFSGLGKPEPLKRELRGYWSRRITKEHRLVYSVSDSAVIIISCKYHYE